MPSSHRYVHIKTWMNIHCSFIHINPKLGTTQMSFNRWLAENVDALRPWIATLRQREATIDTGNNLDGSPWNSAEWKGQTPKGHMLFNFIYNSILEMTKLSRWKINEWWPGFSDEADGNRRKVDAVIKHPYEVSSWWWDSESLDCGGGYRSLHKWWICIELNTHKNPSQTGEVRKTGELYQWQWYSTCDIIR